MAYASDRGAPSGSEGNLDIWVQQIGGGEPIRLTRDPANEREPAFSPDDTRIAFRSEREGGGIYVIPALGGSARRIAPDGRRPQFSPDGNWIASPRPRVSAPTGRQFSHPVLEARAGQSGRRLPPLRSNEPGDAVLDVRRFA